MVANRRPRRPFNESQTPTADKLDLTVEISTVTIEQMPSITTATIWRESETEGAWCRKNRCRAQHNDRSPDLSPAARAMSYAPSATDI
jgi:hypothetical protein